MVGQYAEFTDISQCNHAVCFETPTASITHEGP
jgi:hypothetical protein